MIRRNWNADWIAVWKWPESNEKKAERVRLPHDVLRGIPGAENGKIPGSVVYTKYFFVPKAWKGKTRILFFENILGGAFVYVNGSLAGETEDGFEGMEVCLDSYLNFGKTNEIRVEVTNNPKAKGMGLCRNVVLFMGEAVHVKKDGICIESSLLQDGTAQLKAALQLASTSCEEEKVLVRLDICMEGDLLLRGEKDIFFEAQSEKSVYFQMNMQNPLPWSAKDPKVYAARVWVYRKEELLDIAVCPFAVAGELQKPQKVFSLSEDYGTLGRAVYDRAEEMRCKLCKEAGADALVIASPYPVSRNLKVILKLLGLQLLKEEEALGIPVMECPKKEVSFGGTDGMQVDFWPEYLHADGEDLAFLQISCWEGGRLSTLFFERVNVRILGEGELLGIDEQKDGTILVILRALEKPGKISVEILVDGRKAANTFIPVHLEQNYGEEMKRLSLQ